MKKTLNEAALIIVNYNTAKLTIHSVRHILELNTGIRIIIVDNASTDGSGELLKREFENEADIFLLQSPKNGGYAKGNNLGIALAEKIGGIEYIGIMNPDVVAGKEALYALAEVLKKDRTIGLVTTQVIYNGRKLNPNPCAWSQSGLLRWLVGVTMLGTLLRRVSRRMTGREVDLIGYCKEKALSQAINPVFAVQGCFFFGRLALMQAIGGFDERTFLYYEEDILARKVSAIGLRNAVLRDFWIEHNHQEKDASLESARQRLFHMRCEYQSRCLYLREYAGYGPVVRVGIAILWEIDYAIKKRLVRILYRE